MLHVKKIAGVVGVVVSLIAFNSHADEGIDTILNSGLSGSGFVLASGAKTLGGDAGLACEMLLCLSAVGSAPSACKGPLKKYFSMKPKRRAGFLSKCPKVSG